MDHPERLPDLLLALALCAPVACLTPGAALFPGTPPGALFGPLDGAIRPEVVGSAVIAWAALVPLAFTLLAHLRAGRRGLRTVEARGALAWVGAGLLAWIGARSATDTFELARAELLLVATFALLLGGAALSEDGRRLYARGLVVLSLALTLGALGAELAGHAAGLGGALGNTGSISEAAVPGAAIGAHLFANRRGPWRWIGLAAVLAFGAHVGAAPVLAGALSLGLALTVAATLVRDRTRWFVALGALALAFGVSFFARSSVEDDPAAEEPAAAAPGLEEPAAVAGGLAVRSRLWTSVARLAFDHPLDGVGAGQFAAAFPPYRDPLEIELSSHERRLWQQTEVEHAHADVLQVTAEAGLVGGALFVAFLARVLRRARRAFRAGSERAPLAVAALALVANGLARTPLTWNPASAAIAFGTFGALLSVDAPASAARRWIGRLVPWAALLLVAVRLSVATGLVRHERALRASFAALAELGELPGRAATTGGVAPGRAEVAAALAERPDSPLAHSHAARLDALTGEPPERVREHWRRILELRPASIEALIQDGVFAVRSGRRSEARARWRRVIELDPNHPIARRNLIRLAAEVGDVAPIEEHSAALERLGRLSEAFLLEVAAEAGARGRANCVEALLARVVDVFAPEVVHALAQREKQLGHLATELGLRAHAHRLWGSEHAAGENWERAARSLREARAAAASCLGEPSVPLEREYAAALWRAGRPDEARAVLAELEPDEGAPPISIWAREALAELAAAAR